MARMLRQLAAVAGKDLRVEARSREIIYTVGFFAALIVLVMTFAFDHTPRFSRTAAPGIIWAAIAFAGVLGLGRAFDSLGAGYQRPFELATLRLQNMAGILPKCEYSPRYSCTKPASVL